MNFDHEDWAQNVVLNNVILAVFTSGKETEPTDQDSRA